MSVAVKTSTGTPSASSQVKPALVSLVGVLFLLACLAIVGVTTFVSLTWGQGSCMLSGFTLSTMAVTATIDFGLARQTSI